MRDGYVDAVTEAEVIDRSSSPASVDSIVDDLTRLGVEAGEVVIVHSSLSALGWVAGGAQAVVEALLRSVGPSGTLVMPTQSGQLSDPANWSQPPVPADWIEPIRAGLPAYDPSLTPTRSMGEIVECFRRHPATIRSPHPLVSFAANGPAAHQIVGEHPLTPALGETSPLARLYDLDARVLLLGVGHANNTSLHLAEHRAEWHGKLTTTESAPILVDGERRWTTWTDLDVDEDDFDQIGAALAHSGIETIGRVGAGEARLGSQRAIVDVAVEWMQSNRPGSLA